MLLVVVAVRPRESVTVTVIVSVPAVFSVFDVNDEAVYGLLLDVHDEE